MTKLFRCIMAFLVIQVAKRLGYTPDEVLAMYDRAENGLPILLDR